MFKTKEEINKPYDEFVEHVRIINEKQYISIGEIDVIIRAKGGTLFGLLDKGLLIQHPTKLSYFRVE